jgi:hypothetical protein
MAAALVGRGSRAMIEESKGAYLVDSEHEKVGVDKATAAECSHDFLDALQARGNVLRPLPAP